MLQTPLILHLTNYTNKTSISLMWSSRESLKPRNTVLNVHVHTCKFEAFDDTVCFNNMFSSSNDVVWNSSLFFPLTYLWTAWAFRIRRLRVETHYDQKEKHILNMGCLKLSELSNICCLNYVFTYILKNETSLRN